MNCPMNPNNFLVAMLDVYVQWLNTWIRAEPSEVDEYTMDSFLQYTQGVKAIVVTGDSSAYQRVLVEASVSDGDEGGPTDLTAWFDIRPDTGTNPMLAMVQGFDTSLQFIFNDEKLVNLP